MAPRRCLAHSSVLALLACLALAAVAHGTEPPRVITDAAPPASGAPAQAVAAACSLAPGALSNTSLMWNDPSTFTSFAWRIPVSSCTACAATGALDVKSVAIRLRWWSACSAQAEISIVGATGDPACRVPDPTHVLCGPATYTISGTGATGTIHTLPLPSGCCISGEAFALVRLTGLEACASTPGGPSVGITAASAACSGCEQYVTVSGLYPAPTEWCSIPNVSAPLWMQVDADCCAFTDAPARSWGTLKTLYR